MSSDEILILSADFLLFLWRVVAANVEGLPDLVRRLACARRTKAERAGREGESDASVSERKALLLSFTHEMREGADRQNDSG